MVAKLSVNLWAWILVLSLVAPTAALAVLCPGDCNGNGRATASDAVRLGAVPGGALPLRFCPGADANGDKMLSQAEVLGAIGRLFEGCPDPEVYMSPAGNQPAGPVDLTLGILPNGRRVTPAGVQIPTETLPLTLVLTDDESALLVTNDGYGDEENRQFVQVVDTDTLEVNKTEVPHFLGLALGADGRAFVGSDINSQPDRIDALQLNGSTLEREAGPVAELPNGAFPADLALSPDGARLYALGMRNNTFYSIDVATGDFVSADQPIGNLPFDVVLSADGKRAYVSSWGINNGNPSDFVPTPLPPLMQNVDQRSSVAVINLDNPAAPHLIRYVKIGASAALDNRNVFGGTHPSAMALSHDGSLLYVTATNVDVLDVIDTSTLEVVAEIDLNVVDDQPALTQLQGLYPNAIAVSADGSRVYVADAGINAVQVIDVNPAQRTFTHAGFIPTGWYPSALALTADGNRLYVANGKGTGVGPNGGDLFDDEAHGSSYIAQLLKGSVSVVDGVDALDLEASTAQVLANNGLLPHTPQWVAGEAGPGEVSERNPVPIDFGYGASEQIRHVVFILKENRTYDQIFGELETGNGDPNLAFFGSAITPNHTALARQFAVGDNFYDDAEVSTPGHEWTDQANCNDWIEKMWPQNYDRNLPSQVLEFGQEGFTKGGYIWQAMGNQGVSYRIYGETLGLLSRFAYGTDGRGPGTLAVPLGQAFGRLPNESEIFALINGQIADLEAQGVNVDILRTTVWPNQMIDFPSNILADRTDEERAALFKSELDAYVEQGSLPAFLHIWLPNDHTFGARAGTPTTRSAVSDNDLGLGLIVEALSNTPFWRDMAIFVTEDDAQDGRDHVSAHRTVGMVIGPWVKHGYVSHVHHSNVSMTKTMSLLLGIKPMSQYDRYATDMRDYFTDTPDFTPYTALPRGIPPETNPSAAQAPNAYLRRAAEMSDDLNLEMYDEAGAKLSQVIELVHLGNQMEQRSRMPIWLVGAALLLFGAAAFGRRLRPASAA